MSKKLAKILRTEMSASLPVIAKILESKGRNRDEILAHINEDEAELLRMHGGSGTINPETGLMEFYDGGTTSYYGEAGEYKPQTSYYGSAGKVCLLLNGLRCQPLITLHMVVATTEILLHLLYLRRPLRLRVLPYQGKSS